MMFDDEFEKMFKRLSRPFEDVEDLFEKMKQQGGNGGDLQTLVPYYYGYTIRTGPDGKPEIKEFGNIKPSLLPNSSQREPFVDQVYDDKNKTLKLVAEMPGVEKKDISVTVEGQTVYIDAEQENRKYHTGVPVDYKVDENSAKATYSNGILEVALKVQEEPEKPKGKQVEIQ